MPSVQAPLETGTQEHPISILNDTEEKVAMNQKLENGRNSLILQKAKLSHNQQDHILAIVKTKIRGSLSHKENRLKNEMIAFFRDRLVVDISKDYFLPRYEANLNESTTQLTDLALMVHGVDYLDTQTIGNMFTIPGHEPRRFIHKIVWMDDSNCLVIFLSPTFTTDAINHLLLKPDDFKTKAEEENTVMVHSWFEITPYDLFGIKRQLFIRKATEDELELKKKDQNQPSCFEGFTALKDSFFSFLLKKYRAVEDYEKFQEELLRERHRRSKSNHRRFEPTDNPKFKAYTAQRDQHRDKAPLPIVQEESIIMKADRAEIIDVENAEGNKIVPEDLSIIEPSGKPDNADNAQEFPFSILDELEEPKVSVNNNSVSLPAASKPHTEAEEFPFDVVETTTNPKPAEKKQTTDLPEQKPKPNSSTSRPTSTQKPPVSQSKPTKPITKPASKMFDPLEEEPSY